MTAAAPTAAQPKSRRRWQYGLRTLLIVVTAIGLFLGVGKAFYKWAEGFAMKIERDAARERVLRTGDVMDYDRRLLGDEADSLKSQHRKESTQDPPTH